MPSACPRCRKPADPAYRPFCSQRCRDIDLGSWLIGRYAVPASTEDELPGNGEDEP